MSKIKVVHYINQFFAQIGGEEKADYPAEIRVGEVVGPGLALTSIQCRTLWCSLRYNCGCCSGRTWNSGSYRYVYRKPWCRYVQK